MKAIKRQRRPNTGLTPYDAAQTSDQRSVFWLQFPLTGEKEFTQLNRKNILRKKRALEANLPLVPALIEKAGRYAVGHGLFPVPITSDQAWNERTMAKFDEWASNRFVCDAMGQMNFWQMQRWVAETYSGEGEAFAGLVRTSKSAAPQIQLFDNGEIESPLGSVAPSSPASGIEYWDGVKFKNGRLAGYSVRTQDTAGFVDVDYWNMIHVCKRKRPNQVRGISPFAPGANCGIDALDETALEVASSKLHAALAVAINKKAGQGAGSQGLSGMLSEILGAGADGSKKGIGENFMGGAAIAQLGEGEDIKLLTSTRPNMNVVQFLEWLYRNIAVGWGVSFDLIWNMSNLGGAPARITLADDQWFFDRMQDDINDDFNYRVWVWWLSCMFENGYEMPNDPQWWRAEWQGPPKLTADAGRTAQSEIDMLNSGLGTWGDYWNRQGRNWKPKITGRVMEVKFAIEECERIGVPYEKVFPPKAGAAPSPETLQPEPTPQPAQS